MAFGDKNSPTAVNQEQIRTLIKAVNDTSLTTKEFSGYVSLASGSINAAEAYALGLAGITYIGATTAVEFSVTADKTTIADNESVTFDSPEIPVSALVFSVENILVSKGNVTADDILNNITLIGNVLRVKQFGNIGEIRASIVIKAETRYTPKTSQSITIDLNVKLYENIIVSEDSYNFDSANVHSFTLDYSPVDATIPVVNVSAEFQKATDAFSIVSVNTNEIKVQCKSTDTLEFNSLNIVATDRNGNRILKDIAISNKVTTTAFIEGVANVITDDANYSGVYQFVFVPSSYNVDVEIVSVTSSNELLKIKNVSLSGFVAYVENLATKISSTITAIAKIDGYEFEITKEISIKVVNANGHEFVDLGLPSGLLWAKYNVGATTEEGEGLYFQWGDTEGHAKGSGYNFNNDNYIAKGLDAISGDLALSQDAANANMGGTCRMPTRFEFQELRDNCTWEWTTQNGVNGYKITSKNNGNSIFLSASGGYDGTSLYYFGSCGYFWSRSFYSSSDAYSLYFNSSSVYPQSSGYRNDGFSVRAVL